MTQHRVFLYNPSRPGSRIIEVEATIEVLAKASWASYRGKRHLLGSTAFYTLAAANRAKRGALQKVWETTALDRMSQTMGLRSQARWQLDYYSERNEFPLTRRLN